MSKEYSIDSRSEEQFKKDKDKWEIMERAIITHLSQHFPVYYSWKFYDCLKWEHSNYNPDWIIFMDWVYFPLEVKYTDRNITFVDLKENQWRRLCEWKWVYIQCKEVRQNVFYFCLINPLDRWELRDWKEKKTYCNKPCYRYYPEWQKAWLVKLVKNFIYK